MQLRYYVQFKAEDKKAEYALKEKLINIEGVAIDSSVNKNKWQVPNEDLDYIVETLKGAQLRVDHAESALMIIGKVVDAWRDGDRVFFRAEVGDEKMIEKIVRGYVSYVSVQVDSDNVECSKCKRPTRKEGMLVHLCPGAWEIVRQPKVRELSIVASPAYSTTEFKPLGFFQAMTDEQWQAIVNAISKNQTLGTTGEVSPNLSSTTSPFPDLTSTTSPYPNLTATTSPYPQISTSQSPLKEGDNVGSKPQGLQEPENKTVLEAKEEVKPMSVKADEQASPHQAQGVVNVAPGETSPKQVEYEDFMKQLE
ncbi:MAG: hypothetical protein QXO67_03825, partial [Candidatus Bathyarchaeia archaeon]